MTTPVVLFVALCLLAYALVQRRLKTTIIAGPMIFVLFGVLASSEVLGSSKSIQAMQS